MKNRVLLDSSVWIEWLTRGKRLTSCQRYMDKSHIVGVPSLVIFEVCRKVTTKVSEDESLRVAAWLRTFGILNLNDEVALHAVDLSISYKLGMADSLVLAHAMRENAQLVTLDNDFATIKDAVVVRA
ncbi:MAG: type II toxin-antitoxin system VapC family toxin [Proteobacteria bacterium]|nr:type II toxin-antitoxin system VapC family toxin [Pseudomonadota bacterium]